MGDNNGDLRGVPPEPAHQPSIKMIGDGMCRLYLADSTGSLHGRYCDVAYAEIVDYVKSKRPRAELIGLYFNGSNQASS